MKRLFSILVTLLILTTPVVIVERTQYEIDYFYISVSIYNNVCELNNLPVKAYYYEESQDGSEELIIVVSDNRVDENYYDEFTRYLAYELYDIIEGYVSSDTILPTTRVVVHHNGHVYYETPRDYPITYEDYVLDRYYVE